MGRPRHSFWAGFEAVDNPYDKKRIAAKCRKCKFIETNTQQKRLQNHKCENHGYKHQKTSTSIDASSVSTEVIDLGESSQEPQEPPATGTKQVCIKNFVDHIPNEESNQLNKLFGKFLYSEGISPEVLNNKYLQDFLKKIRPSFKAPAAEYVQKEILDSIYCDILEAAKAKQLEEGILLLDFIDPHNVS